MLSWWKLPTDTNYKAKAARVKGKRLTKAKLLEFFESMK